MRQEATNLAAAGLFLLMLKNTLLEAVRSAGEVLTRFMDTDYIISNKEGINNLVTEADHASEKAIIDVISRNFPGHHILSEECGDIVQDSEYKWIIDPIDGTVNFAHGIPICCVSIGIEREGRMVMGAIFNPFMKELYFAERGEGAMMNDRRISVSSKTTVEKACLVTGFPYTYLDEPNGPLEVFERFIRKGIPVRRLGSAAIDLAWVACGRFDGFYEHKLQAWDSAAGFILVEEAGGRVSNLKGDAYSPYQPGIVASNGLLHEQIVEWINPGARKQPVKE